MAESKSVNADRSRKRVEAEAVTCVMTHHKRPKNNCIITDWCEACNEIVDVALTSTHECGRDAKIKKNLDKMFVETVNGYISKSLEERTELMRVKKAKNERDPSKKPLTPFFHFMEDFRKSYNKANPDNKKVSVVGREGGEKWRAMSEEEKKPYTERAAKQQAAHDEYWRIQVHDSPIIRKKRQELREAEEEAEEALMMDEEWFCFHYKGY